MSSIDLILRSRALARRLEGWSLARPCRLPSFETRASFDKLRSALLRMRFAGSRVYLHDLMGARKTVPRRTSRAILSWQAFTGRFYAPAPYPHLRGDGRLILTGRDTRSVATAAGVAVRMDVVHQRGQRLPARYRGGRLHGGDPIRQPDAAGTCSCLHKSGACLQGPGRFRSRTGGL